jgi:hypothetical protein
MATNAVRHISTEPKNRSTGWQSKSNSYQAPTLVKGAILSAVTALLNVSGITQDK